MPPQLVPQSRAVPPPVQIFDLPVDTEPQDLDGEETLSCKSIGESYVLLQSLRQSRYLWLTSILPKLPITPRYFLHHVGKCSLEIGPHTFHGVSIEDVRYTPQLAPIDSTGPSSTRPRSDLPKSLQSSVTSSLGEQLRVSPAMINHITEASASDPALSNLLLRASSHVASEQELHALGDFFKLLAASFSNDESAIKQLPIDLRPDIAIKFPENSRDIFLLPRDTTLFSSKPQPTGNPQSVVLCVKVSSAQPAAGNTHLLPLALPKSSGKGSSPEAKTALIEFTSPSRALELLLSNRFPHRAGRTSVKTPRTFLQYRLEDGVLQKQLQTANTRKFVLLSDAVQSAKKAAQSKRKVTRTNKSVKPVGQPVPQGTNATAQVVTQNKAVINPATPLPAPPPSRRITMKPRPRNANTIPPTMPYVPRCKTCGKTDVPLILRASFCRTCADAQGSEQS